MATVNHAQVALDEINDLLEELREVANPPVPNLDPLPVVTDLRMHAFAMLFDAGEVSWDGDLLVGEG